MKRLVKVALVSCAALVTLGVIGAVRANAAEATLTEVVEAVKADQVQVEALKTENHSDLVGVAALLHAPLAVTLSGEPTVKVPLPLEVSCASGCAGGGGGGELELTPKAEAKLAEGNKESAVFIVGAICGLFLCLVFWTMIRPRNA